MPQTLTLELSGQLLETLRQRAAATGKPIEQLIAECLARALLPRDDRFLRWEGAFESGVPDATERLHERRSP